MATATFTTGAGLSLTIQKHRGKNHILTQNHGLTPLEKKRSDNRKLMLR